WVAHHDRRTAHHHDISVADLDLLDRGAIDSRAIGGSEINQIDLDQRTRGEHPEFRMLATDARVVDAQVSVAASANDKPWRPERVELSVDLEYGGGPAA